MRTTGLLLICVLVATAGAQAAVVEGPGTAQRLAAAGPRPPVSDGEHHVAWTLRGRLRVHDARTGRTRDHRLPPGCDRVTAAAAGTVLLGCPGGPSRVWRSDTRRIGPLPGAHAEDYFEWVGRYWAVGFAGEEGAPKAPAVPVAVNLQGGERIEEPSGFGTGCIDPNRSSPAYVACDDLGTVTTSGSWLLRWDCCHPQKVSLFREGRFVRHLARDCGACTAQLSAGWATVADRDSARRATVRGYDLRTRSLTEWRVRAGGVSSAHTRGALFIRARGAVHRVPRPGRAPRPLCGPATGTTIATTSRLRIYAGRRGEHVCGRGAARSWPLTGAYDDEACTYSSQGCSGRTGLRVAGRWVLEAEQWSGQDSFVNLRLQAAGERRPSDFARVDFLHGSVLSSSGSAVVIGTDFVGPERAPRTAVRRLGACGSAVLDEGDGIVGESLRLDGERATWLHGGELRSADLCPR